VPGCRVEASEMTKPVITPPYTPELLPEAWGRMEGFLRSRKGPRVLEFGAGYSTVAFCLTGAEVVSVEHDPDWWEGVNDALRECGLWCDLRLVDPVAFPCQVRFPDWAYDLVYVDCVDGLRVACAREALHHLKPDGLLVLDDTHWDLWKPVLSELAGWKQEIIRGMHTRKTGDVCYHQTHLLWR
jgi:predicted O-methyltransferase YrrM